MKTLAVLSAALAISIVAAWAARADDTEVELDPAATTAFAKRLFAGAVNEKKKSYACFVRRYDGAHLAAHPKQRVREMRLLVSAETVPEDTGLNYKFQLGLRFRDKPGKFDTSGDCGHVRPFDMSADKMHLGCGVDCDGGGISVELSNSDKSTLIRLDEVGIWNNPNKPADLERTSLSAGADDGLFRLDRASLEDCRILVPDREEWAAMRHK